MASNLSFYFLFALKNFFLLLLIAIPFFLATTFAVTPVSFHGRPSENSLRSPEERPSSHEADSGDASSLETRGSRLTATEHDTVVENDGMNPVAMTGDHDLLVEEELEEELVEIERAHQEESSVIATALHHSQENGNGPYHSFAPVFSGAHRFEENEDHPIAAIHSSDYLKNLRNKLFPQQNSFADEHQIMESEVMVNQAALADGLSPEELRVLRAQETCEFFLPAFKAVQKLVMSTSLNFYNLTRETTKLPQEVWNKYSAAVQSQKEIFESCQQAEQELEDALNSWKATGGSSVVATAIRDEGSF